MTKEDDLKRILGKEYTRFRAFRDSKWVGPFRISELLENCLSDDFPKPPETNSVYLISKNSWERSPSLESIPLYVGSTTGKSARFRTRIGDLVADMFGFFQLQTAHSSGGISLYYYCKEASLNPGQLYIAWLEKCGCARCAEHYFWEFLEPELNDKRPPECKRHTGDERYSAVTQENSNDTLTSDG